MLLAGLLYLGSGIGLSALRSLRRLRGGEAAPLSTADVPWLVGAVLFGGVVGPVLLMLGLRRIPASVVALLLAHSHSHVHDEHHRHEHEPGMGAAEPHTHLHVHAPLVHRHLHYPDIHHRHSH